MKPALLSILVLTATAVLAADPAPDKTQYNLFNPTPPQWLREMSTDRPDKTERAYTVDAGHFQIEMDLVNYSYDKHNPARDGVGLNRLYCVLSGAGSAASTAVAVRNRMERRAGFMGEEMNH